MGRVGDGAVQDAVFRGPAAGAIRQFACSPPGRPCGRSAGSGGRSHGFIGVHMIRFPTGGYVVVVVVVVAVIKQSLQCS